jgi:hypothetical protein
MKKIKYPNVLLTHYELIKNAPIEFRGVLSYALLCYNFEDVKNNIPAEAMETWAILQKKVDAAKKSQKYGATGGYYLHKKQPTTPKIEPISVAESPAVIEKPISSRARATTTISNNINNNITTNIPTTAGNVKQEKSTKVINKSKTPEFIPPTLEEVIKFFTENGYTVKAATICFNYYEDGDWIDSQGRPVQNWKRKVRFNWFKPEYLEVKGSVYTRKEYRPA